MPAMKAAVLELLADYNRRDAPAVCARYTPQVRASMTRVFREIFHAPLTCRQVIAVAFKPGKNWGSGENTGPAYTHVSAARWVGSATDAGYGEIAADVRATFPGMAADMPASSPKFVVFWFSHEHGRLLLAQASAVGSILQGSAPSPLASLHPVTPADAHAPAPLGPPSFRCAGTQHHYPDAANDPSSLSPAAAHVAAPWLDIRSVTTQGLNGPHPCIRITFGARVRPDTDIEFVSNQSPAPSLAIGGKGDCVLYGLLGIGEKGNELVVRVDPADPIWGTDAQEVSICAAVDTAADSASPSFADTRDAWTRGHPTQPTAC
jgi:hypothetical protein